jgi:hypothetical protein
VTSFSKRGIPFYLILLAKSSDGTDIEVIVISLSKIYCFNSFSLSSNYFWKEVFAFGLVLS